MKSVLSLLGVMLAALIVNNASAGNVSELTKTAFSSDGRYFSFTTYDSDGMSSTECLVTTFVNVARNSWVTPPLKVCTAQAGEFEGSNYRQFKQRSQKAKRAIKRWNRKLGIRSRNYSNTPVNRAAFRYHKQASQARRTFARPGESLTFANGRKNKYRLNLKRNSTSLSRCNNYTGLMFGQRPAMLSLSVKNLINGRSRMLQKDRRVPKSRGCPFSYRIQTVYTRPHRKGTAMVVLLQYFSPSIEGPNEKYLAVTGLLP